MGLRRVASISSICVIPQKRDRTEAPIFLGISHKDDLAKGFIIWKTVPETDKIYSMCITTPPDSICHSLKKATDSNYHSTLPVTQHWHHPLLAGMQVARSIHKKPAFTHVLLFKNPSAQTFRWCLWGWCILCPEVAERRCGRQFVQKCLRKKNGSEFAKMSLPKTSWFYHVISWNLTKFHRNRMVLFFSVLKGPQWPTGIWCRLEIKETFWSLPNKIVCTTTWHDRMIF